MDPIELTKLFVQYGETQALLGKLERQIKEAILSELEPKSMKMAGVTATYYAPSVDTDYEAFAKDQQAPQEVIDRNTTVIKKVSWKAVIEDLGITEVPSEYITPKPARVTIK